jgi:uncharacterized protein (TIGR02145 family)
MKEKMKEQIKKNKKLLLIISAVLVVFVLVLYIFGGSGLPSLKNSSIPKDAEGYVYETVEIGNQVWFAENLNTAVHSEGESWCYEEKDENCEIYGRLYDWKAASVACPEGWTLPSDEDWQELEEYIDSEDMLGAKLKSTNLWTGVDGDEIEEGFEGLDEYDISLAPGGHYVDGYFYDIAIGGFWWTSSQEDGGPVWSRTLLHNSNDITRSIFGPEHAFSVRCLKEAVEEND